MPAVFVACSMHNDAARIATTGRRYLAVSSSRARLLAVRLTQLLLLAACVGARAARAREGQSGL